MSYYYVITNKADDSKRLVKASSPTAAITFVAKDEFSAMRVPDEVVSLIDLPLEKVTAEKPEA